MILADIRPGDRVELAPMTHAYCAGYRTGRVVKLSGRSAVLVECEPIGEQGADQRTFHPANLVRVL